MKLFDEITLSKLDLLSTSTFSSVGTSSAKAAPKRAIAVNRITLILKQSTLHKPARKTKLYKMPNTATSFTLVSLDVAASIVVYCCDWLVCFFFNRAWLRSKQ